MTRLLVLLFALFSVATAETYLGYENRAVGFAIAYPKNWVALENAQKTGVSLTERNSTPNANRPAFVVSVSQASPGVKLDDYDRLMPRLFKFLFEDYTQHLKQPTKLGGADARMLLFEAKIGKFPVVGFLSYTIRNGRVYTATFFSLREDYERFRQVGGNILGTFRFL